MKTLANDDPWLDDTAAWVEKSRKLAKEKEMADKRVRAKHMPFMNGGVFIYLFILCYNVVSWLK